MLIGVAALLLANVVFADASGAREGVRASLIGLFMASGVAALVLSLRALLRTERSIVVWVALVYGLLATTLTLAEFTLLE